MSEPKITHRGWAGHFIQCNRCRFRLNTLIEFENKKIVVSTVGVLEGPDGKGFMEVGLDRHFETMAFHADPKDEFLDADVGRPVKFNSKWSIKGLDSKAEIGACQMHADVVQELVAKLKKGVR